MSVASHKKKIKFITLNEGTITMQDDRQKWVDFVKEDFPLFKEIYQSEDDMIRYCLKFENAYGTYKDAFHEFYNISEYYLAIKLLTVNEQSSGNMLKDICQSRYKKNEDILTLMMAISLIEKLSSKKDYIPFSNWLKNKEAENESNYQRIKQLWRDYNEDILVVVANLENFSRVTYT
ncbi:MAG: hypothetical protein M1490_05970 [Candidatus Bathyarchaeota archaeon]|nr:hypothetical protein [Candidatus Bathyarchaeota archaeon]